MKKHYFSPTAECVPMVVQTALLNNASFDGVGLNDATEVIWGDGTLVDFPSIL